MSSKHNAQGGKTPVAKTRQKLSVPIREDGEVHRADTFAQVPFELIRDPNISDGAVRLYAHMLWRYGSRKSTQDNQNFERRKTMAEALGVKPRTITRRIKELERANWIAVIMQSNWKGYTSNFYHVFQVRKDCQTFKKRHERILTQRSEHRKASKRQAKGAV